VTNLFKPIFFHLSNESDKTQLKKLRKEGRVFQEFDTIDSQIQELIKCKNPQRLISPKESFLIKLNFN
jgi:hypothetical protein